MLHRTSAPHLRPPPALRHHLPRLRLQYPRPVSPRVKCRCVRQRSRRARRSTTTRRRPRLLCWLRRASREGCRGSGCTSRRDRWRTWSSRGRSTNLSSTASTRIRIPSEYVPRTPFINGPSVLILWSQLAYNAYPEGCVLITDGRSSPDVPQMRFPVTAPR